MSSALLGSRESYVGEQAIEVVFRPFDDGVTRLGSAPARLAIKVLILLGFRRRRLPVRIVLPASRHPWLAVAVQRPRPMKRA